MNHRDNPIEGLTPVKGTVNENHNPYEAGTSSSIPPYPHASASFPGWSIWGSLVVMLPWPILGIGTCLGLSLLERSSEAVFMFGGATLILLLPLVLFVSSLFENSEWIFIALIGVVWLLALSLPLWLGRRVAQTGFNLMAVLACQSLFSAIQAGLGFLMIIGKHV
jgi:hypothetical protein